MSEVKKTSFRNSIWAKVSLIVVISFMLMIPVSMVEDLIRERHRFSEQAKNEVSQKWSQSQTVGAVMLTIPITQKHTRKDKEGNTVPYWHSSHLHVLPDDLKIQADTETVIRHRGLYRIPLYQTRLKTSGTFSGVADILKDHAGTRVFLDKARLNLGVDDVRGLKKVQVKWNDSLVESSIGNMGAKIGDNAIQAVELGGLKNNGTGRFEISIHLRGSGSLDFLPFGETTEVSMTSNWGDPSFDGAFLPDQYEIQPEAFQAQWKVLGMNRNLPRHWVGSLSLEKKVQKTRFGVKFLIPLETYQLNTRSVKYSLLFVSLTFITLFFIEIMLGLKFHPMHYIVTGAGLCLFYLLLLSFSEHLGFLNAYILAAGATLLSITLYIFGVTQVKKGAWTLFSQMSLLYGFLLVLLKLEDYALVAGASGLWIVLAFLMYLTRRIDWFNLSMPKRGAEARV